MTPTRLTHEMTRFSTTVHVTLDGTVAVQLGLFQRIRTDLELACTRATTVLNGEGGDLETYRDTYEAALFRYRRCFENVRGYGKDSKDVTDFMKSIDPEGGDDEEPTISRARNDTAHRGSSGVDENKAVYVYPSLEFSELVESHSETVLNHEVLRQLVTNVKNVLPRVEEKIAVYKERLRREAAELTPLRKEVEALPVR